MRWHWRCITPLPQTDKSKPHWVIRYGVELLLLSASILTLWKGGGCMVLAQNGWTPPQLEMVNALHCEVSPTTYGFAARAEATYLNHDQFKREPWHLIIALIKPKNNSEKASEKAELEAAHVCITWKRLALKAQQRKFKELNEFPRTKGLKFDPTRQGLRWTRR